MHSRSYALAMAAMLAAGPGPAMSDPVKKEDLVGAWRYETATSSSLTAIAKVSTASIRRAC
jgi:hypothetical protein